ncbi:uncharacterized protein BJ171DRAFT_486527 [Polychytrium aggregatum]|uniref:uncharacterized protein n=1 Tax=Polychytrium aggregatum TaxID=110093 RepID=UPI0022FE0137|nr:uncharacterized protein BJ171DRAFT_486527 [Polychytrium aggregatum]KAI9209348.1 hypothetical protein BJ171DRAFT_486527 [Polychytrium aggregatum]
MVFVGLRISLDRSHSQPICSLESTAMFRAILRRSYSTGQPILPTTRFANAVAQANYQWLNQALELPLVHKPTNTKVHILGVSSLNFNAKPHSQAVISQLQPRAIAIDEDPRSKERYQTYDSLFSELYKGLGSDTAEPDLDQIASFVEQHRDRFENKIPDNYIRAIELTGIRPFWDHTVACLHAIEHQLPLEWIQIPSSVLERSMTALAPANVDEVESKLSEDDRAKIGAGMSTELEALFGTVNVHKKDLSAVRTGNPMVDNKIQNLVLTPEAMMRYKAVLSSWLNRIDGWDKFEISCALREVHYAEQLKDFCLELAKQSPEQPERPVLAIVDRIYVPGLRKEWETDN